MHVVRDLVRLDADQRWVCPVDGAVEPFLVDSLQWLRKDRPKTRIEVTPEWLAAADQVLPQPRLALVNAHRRAAPQRGPLELGRTALLVQGVPGLVHRGQQRLRDKVRVEARRDPHVIAGEGGAERVRGRVLAPVGEVVAEGADESLGELPLAGHVILAVQHRIVDRSAALDDRSHQ